LEFALLNTRIAHQFTRSWESSAGMPIRRGTFSFIWLNPVQLDLGSREAVTQRSSTERALEGRRNVIKRLHSKLRSNKSSAKFLEI